MDSIKVSCPCCCLQVPRCRAQKQGQGFGGHHEMAKLALWWVASRRGVIAVANKDRGDFPDLFVSLKDGWFNSGPSIGRIAFPWILIEARAPIITIAIEHNDEDLILCHLCESLCISVSKDVHLFPLVQFELL